VRALVIAALAAGCSRASPPVEVRDDAAPRAAAPTRAVESGKAAASCPAMPELSPARQGRPVELTVAKVVSEGNKTRAYEMMYVAAETTGTRWAGSAYDGAVVWRGTAREREIACAGCTPHQVAFAANGKTLLVGLNRMDLDGGTVTPLAEVQSSLQRAGTNEVTSVAWPPDGEVVVAATHFRPSACCRDRSAPSGPSPPDKALVLDGTTGALVRELEVIPGFSGSVAASARQIVVGTNGGLTAWDRADFTATTRAEPPYAGRLQFHPSGRLLVTSMKGEITLWRMPDFCPVGRFTADREFVHAIAFHPTAPVMFTVGSDRSIHVFSTEAPGEALGSAEVPGANDIAEAARSIAITGDGKTLIAPLYLRKDVVFFDVRLP
jgi:hypothetical protein